MEALYFIANKIEGIPVKPVDFKGRSWVGVWGDKANHIHELFRAANEHDDKEERIYEEIRKYRENYDTKWYTNASIVGFILLIVLIIALVIFWKIFGEPLTIIFDIIVSTLIA